MESGDRALVLVVEDNRELRRYVCEALADQYRVEEESDGEDGLKKARDAYPDVVVTDVMMPRLEGLAMVAALRRDPDTECTPILMLSSRSAVEDRIAGVESGADDYLPKPFDMDELRARLTALLESRRRLRREAGEATTGRSEDPSSPALVEPAFLRRFRHAVTTSIADPGLSMEELARALYMSRAQLFRKVRQVAETTPAELVRRLRLEEARRLLDDPGLSISEIAYSVGFASRSHFIRCFRTELGETPGRMRSGRRAAEGEVSGPHDSPR